MDSTKAVILTKKIRNEGPDVLIVPLLTSEPGAENDWDVKPMVLAAAQKVVPSISMNQIILTRPRAKDDAPTTIPEDTYRWYAEWRMMKGF